jgi:uncharacterized protein
MTPLRIDVADLLAHGTARRELEVATPLSGLAGSAARVADDEPVVLEVVLERISDGIVVRGSVTTRWRADCSVCLAELEQPLALRVNELFEPEPLEGDTYPIEGHEIDLEQLVRDTVILELPLAPVCADTGAPACAEAPERPAESPPASPELADPRWAPLSELHLPDTDQGEAASGVSEGERRDLASERVSARRPALSRMARPATSEREK